MITLVDAMDDWSGLDRWSNLRRFRSVGYDADAAAELHVHAVDSTKRVHERHGWELPPTTIPGPTALE